MRELKSEKLEAMKKEYLKKIRKTNKDIGEDAKDCHYTNDRHLCDLLVDLGFERVVNEYNKLMKWYA